MNTGSHNFLFPTYIWAYLAPLVTALSSHCGYLSEGRLATTCFNLANRLSPRCKECHSRQIRMPPFGCSHGDLGPTPSLFDCVFLWRSEKSAHISASPFPFESDFHRLTHTFWFDTVGGNGWLIL